MTRVSLNDAVAAYEKDLIQDALKTTRGNRAKAARLLDTTERILNYKVRKYAHRRAPLQSVASTRHAQPARNATPPIGVIAPSTVTPVTASR